MDGYFSARCFALAWLNLNKIPVKETATSMRIARTLKCWDGKGGARAAKLAVISWREKAMKSGELKDAPVTADEFYASQAWRAVRYDALKRSRGCCELCGAAPTDAALHVDHIAPRSKYPHLALDINNLQVLCRACNIGKGNRDDTDWRKRPNV